MCKVAVHGSGAFAVFLPISSVITVGDARRYEKVIRKLIYLKT